MKNSKSEAQILRIECGCMSKFTAKVRVEIQKPRELRTYHDL